MKPGKIFADLHTHIGKGYRLEELLAVLSRGITGLTEVTENPGLLTYDEVIQMPGVKEIDKNSFAEVSYQGNKGYVVKSQEVLENRDDFHVLAVGCEKLIHEKDSRKSIEEICRQGKVPIVTHPYVRPTGEWPIKYRLVVEEEKAELEEIYQMLNDLGGEVEVFNAQNICAIPFILDMRKENEKAKQDMQKYPNLKGIAASDTHHRLDQVHTAGIYLPEDTTCLEALTHYLQTSNFERHENYVGKFSFGMGHFFPFI